MPVKFYIAIKMNKLPNPSPQGKAISGDQRHTLLLIAHFLIFIPFAVYFSTVWERFSHSESKGISFQLWLVLTTNFLFTGHLQHDSVFVTLECPLDFLLYVSDEIKIKF
jgi:hypothetical protein